MKVKFLGDEEEEETLFNEGRYIITGYPVAFIIALLVFIMAVRW
jgi:hypothetical protein